MKTLISRFIQQLERGEEVEARLPTDLWTVVEAFERRPGADREKP